MGGACVVLPDFRRSAPFATGVTIVVAMSGDGYGFGVKRTALNSVACDSTVLRPHLVKKAGGFLQF